MADYHGDLRTINDALASASGHMADLRSAYNQEPDDDLAQQIDQLEAWLAARKAELRALAGRSRFWPGK